MRLPIALMLLMIAAAPVLADDRRGEDDILRAVRRGEAKPLSEIQEIVKGQLPGEIIDVEIEREDGMLVYEFKIIDARGRRADAYVDARTGRILRIKRK